MCQLVGSESWDLRLGLCCPWPSRGPMSFHSHGERKGAVWLVTMCRALGGGLLFYLKGRAPERRESFYLLVQFQNG